MDGFSLDNSATFEEWIVLKREQFGRLMLKALRRLANHCEQRGEYEQAQLYAWRQVELEPWQEEGHQQLMRIQACTGRRSAALAQYETCRRVLMNELGVEPSAETIALYQSIRNETFTILTPALPSFLIREAPPHELERSLFVAREKELAQLERFLQQSVARRGQIVFVTGEAGSGKTMLMQEFTRRALAAYPDLIAVSGNCNAYTGLGDPYLPFLEILAMLSGDIEAKWAAGAITREHAHRVWKLMPNVVQALVDDGPELVDRFISGAALLARAQIGAKLQVSRLGGLIKRNSAAPVAVSGQQTDLFGQYTKVLHDLAQHPLLLIVDDLQWADTGSISLLFHIGKHLTGQRILLVGAYRSDDVALGRAGERHPLEPVIHEFQRDYGDIFVDLSCAEGRQWIDAFLDTEPNALGTEFRETLYHHTNGHPLFTVELVRAMQRRGDLVKAASGRWIESAALDWDRLPPRVEAVIAESVCRLPELLQTALTIASVEGEVFTAQAVAHVQAVEPQQIIHSLSGVLSKQHRLVSAAGVERLNGRPLALYRFRHFLFQKYLYSRLDDIERAHLHEAMGYALETLYGDQLVGKAAQLARHFELAGLTSRAVLYLQQAGDRAVQLFANLEAIDHYRHALRLMQTLPNTQERASRELRLRNALGVPLLAVRGFGDVELEQNYAQARELTLCVEDSPELFWVLCGLKNYHELRLSLHTDCELADQMLALAERLKDLTLRLIACHMRSTTALYQGDLDVFVNYREQASVLYQRDRHRGLVFQLGLDPEAAGLAHAGWAYWVMGYPDQARQQCQAAVDWANELQHPFMIAMTYFFAAQLHCYLRDAAKTRIFAEATAVIARELGMFFWLNASTELINWAHMEETQTAIGLEQLENAFAVTRQLGAELGWVMDIPVLAEAYARAGKIGEALVLLDEGLRITQMVGYRMVEPDLYRCKGDVLLMGNDQASAEACFQQSLDAARRINAKSWELRAALSLARLWQNQGKNDAAHELLSEVYGWFTEGFDTLDLQAVAAHLLK